MRQLRHILWSVAAAALVAATAAAFAPRTPALADTIDDAIEEMEAAAKDKDAGKCIAKMVELQDSLDERFPELEPDLEGLTGAFIQARYAPHPVEQEDVAAVKPLWERVKAALRRRRLG
jgi:hypothetical protein